MKAKFCLAIFLFSIYSIQTLAGDRMCTADRHCGVGQFCDMDLGAAFGYCEYKSSGQRGDSCVTSDDCETFLSCENDYMDLGNGEYHVSRICSDGNANTCPPNSSCGTFSY